MPVAYDSDMSEILLKKHAASAFGLLAQEEDGSWRTTLTVRSLDLEREQNRGPEFLPTEDAASAWVIREAAKHGFGPDDLDFIVEPRNQ